MKNLVKVLLVSVFSMASATVSAATIDGSLIIGGAYQAAGGADLSDANQFTLDTVYANGATDDILGTVDVFTPAGTGGSASLTSFAPVSDFFTVGSWSFDLTTLNIVDQTSSVLNMNGTGYLFVAGELAGHAANWSFSSQSLTSYSMTVTTTVVPVPAAMWLFGTGLIGLIGIARRKA